MITVDDCIPEENIGKNVKRGQTNEAELVTNNKTGGLFDPTKANVAEMDTDEVGFGPIRPQVTSIDREYLGRRIGQKRTCPSPSRYEKSSEGCFEER